MNAGYSIVSVNYPLLKFTFLANQVQKFFSRLRFLAERSQHTTCHRRRLYFGNASHSHTMMFRFHHLTSTFTSKWKTTTATPRGFRISMIANATCFVSRSCNCNLLANISAILAIFESPITFLFGIYPMDICIQFMNL